MVLHPYETIMNYNFFIDTDQIDSLRMNARFFKRVYIKNSLFIKNGNISESVP